VQCEAVLLAGRWPAGFACPLCAGAEHTTFRRGLEGTYHAFDFAKYGYRYLAEAQYRFNWRFDLSTIFVQVLRAEVLTPPRRRD
jgi:hypothetical protein